MSTGTSVMSLSDISLATASMVVLGRQKTTSSRITPATAGLLGSGARRSGSRVRTSVIARSPSFRRAAACGLLLLGEAAQDVLPGLRPRRLGGGGGPSRRGRAHDARPGPLD